MQTTLAEHIDKLMAEIILNIMETYTMEDGWRLYKVRPAVLKKASLDDLHLLSSLVVAADDLLNELAERELLDDDAFESYSDKMYSLANVAIDLCDMLEPLYPNDTDSVRQELNRIAHVSNLEEEL